MSESPEQDGLHGIGRGMLALFWVGVLGLGTWVFSGMLDGRANPNRDPETRFADGVTEVRLQARGDGHYLATGAINGTPVTMLVDTGATSVALPESLARRLGLERGPEITVNTANGRAKAWLTRIDRLQLGGLEFRDVEASFGPGLDTEVLLGMSALGRVDFEQRDGVLYLRQRQR